MGAGVSVYGESVSQVTAAGCRWILDSLPTLRIRQDMLKFGLALSGFVCTWTCKRGMLIESGEEKKGREGHILIHTRGPWRPRRFLAVPCSCNPQITIHAADSLEAISE